MRPLHPTPGAMQFLPSSAPSFLPEMQLSTPNQAVANMRPKGIEVNHWGRHLVEDVQAEGTLPVDHVDGPVAAVQYQRAAGI